MGCAPSLGGVRWTRHPLTRAAALAASVYLVIAYAGERSFFFWVGLVLAALNLAGILAQARSSRRGAPPGPVRADPDADSARLSELMHDAAVTTAWATAPTHWVQVTEPDGSGGPGRVVAAQELAHFARVARVGITWRVDVEAGLWPFLDLDATEQDDVILGVLRAHPIVVGVRREDRGTYVVEPRHEITMDRFARLAARALATGQVTAAARLS